MVAKIIEILVSGVTGMASAIGGGLNSAVVALLWDGTNLTAFAQACLGFGAIALGFGLVKLVYNIVRSKIG